MSLTAAFIVAIAWAIGASLSMLFMRACHLSNERSGESQAREFSDAIELGGAAGFLSIHDAEITDATA